MGMWPKTGISHIKRKTDGSPDVQEEPPPPQLIEEDSDLFKRSALKIPDSTLEEYKDFILEFNDKHWQKVGTGNALYRGKIQEWRERQPKDKKQKLDRLEIKILGILEKTKKGIID